MPLVIIIAVLGIAADQISKLIVAQTIPLEQSVTVIENVLYFTDTGRRDRQFNRPDIFRICTGFHTRQH